MKRRLKHIVFFIVIVLHPALASVAGEPDGYLIADGNTAGTMQLIVNRGYALDSPDQSIRHANKPFQHVQQIWDADLKKYVFQFFIHAKLDDDRGLVNITDRQRNELKTWAKSPAFMVGQEGDIMVIKWKFKLPEGMLTTKKFCHVHQLKALDNKESTADVGMPIITFTCCIVGSGNKQEFQVRWQDRNNNYKTFYLARLDLSQFLGVWVEAEERIKCGANGSYSLALRNLKTGNVMLDMPEQNLDMWRTDCAGVRPKWGIYRNIGENRSMENSLRDEELRFADFYVGKTVSTKVNTLESVRNDSDAIYTVSGESVLKQQEGQVYISQGQKKLSLK